MVAIMLAAATPFTACFFFDAILYNVSTLVEGMEFLDLTIENHSTCANTRRPSCDQHVERVANLVVLQPLGGLKNWQIVGKSAHLALFCVAMRKKQWSWNELDVLPAYSSET